VARADLFFRFQKINLSSYMIALENSFSPILSQHPEGLVSKAEAFILFNTTVRNRHTPLPQEGFVFNPVRWKALTCALDLLTTASRIHTASHLGRIHILRGDIELMRYQLSREVPPYEIAVRNSRVLCQNAEVFYRGAKALCEKKEDAMEASAKEALAKGLGGDKERLKEFLGIPTSRRILEDVIDEGFVDFKESLNIDI
jgi:hypothetical protein